MTVILSSTYIIAFLPPLPLRPLPEDEFDVPEEEDHGFLLGGVEEFDEDEDFPRFLFVLGFSSSEESESE